MERNEKTQTQCNITYPDGQQCDRMARTAGGMCSGHMERKRVYGDPYRGGPLKRMRPRGTPCSIGRVDPWLDEDPCPNEHYSLGFCTKHYARVNAHGDPTITLNDRKHGDTCTVEGCSRPWFASRMCQRHYNTARTYDGDPFGGSRVNDLDERLRRKIVDGGMPKRFFNHASGHYDTVAPCPCRLWTGTLDRQIEGSRHRYGVISIGNDRFQIHRVVYEREVGPIPEGHHLDHLCLQTLCCEPRHLEPVTNSENVRRRWIVVNEIMEIYGDRYDALLAERRELLRRGQNALVWPDDNRSDVS